MAKFKEIYEGAFKLSEWGKFSSVNIFLLIGSERAVLIDSGYGSLDLPLLVKKVCDKPTVIINTHGHFDHVGGNRHFDSYISAEDLEVFKKHISHEFLAQFKMKDIQADLPLTLNNEKIDLGDRLLEVIKTPGHTPGSISILDEKANVLFLGDIVNPVNTFLGLDESTGVTTYKQTLEMLLKLVIDKNISSLYSGHSIGALKPKILENYLEVCNMILRNEIDHKKKWRRVNNALQKGYNTRYKTSMLTWRKI